MPSTEGFGDALAILGTESDANRTQPEWEKLVQQLLDEGEAFLAYDRARLGMAQFPASVRLKQQAARALLRTGAIEEARAVLEPLCAGLESGQDAVIRIYAALRKTLSLINEGGENPPTATLETLGGLLREINALQSNLGAEVTADEETLGILGRIYKDTWKRSGNPIDAIRCRDVYLHAFRQTRGHYSGVNAASMSWLCGDREMALELARESLDALAAAQDSSPQEDPYWIAASRGEALLLLNREEESIQAYTEAARLGARNYAQIVSSLQQIRLLEKHGFPVPGELFEILRPPTVLVCTGHMIDAPGRKEPRFPSFLEGAVRQEIERRIEALDARIGYCSGACGADLLFAEAMIDRDAELNVVLPFEKRDFIRASVEFAGPRWVSRFHKVLKLAHSVRYVTEERYLGDDVLFSFANQIFAAYAQLRAHTLETEPYLLAVWDGKESGLIGGTGDTVSRWSHKDRLEVIRVDEILHAAVSQSGKPPVSPPASVPQTVPPGIPGALTGGPQASPAPGPLSALSCHRDIRTMLFADLVGYSKLPEEYLPYYMYEFLTRVAAQLRDAQEAPEYINTWGDALFVVMDHARPMARYALALQDAICSTDWREIGLPARMSVRIALHAGPVYTGLDPILRRQNFYGSHVNRAARLEPVTVPGCVYTSEQFAAMLTEEQTAERHAAREKGVPYQDAFAADFVGTLSLAKNFGSQAIYHLRRKRDTQDVMK